MSKWSYVRLAVWGSVGCVMMMMAWGGVAAEYYVATNGNDSWNGTITNPWKTIGKASATMVADDTCYIRAGVYNERIEPEKSGNATNGYIRYVGYEPKVVISGKNFTSGNPNGVVINGKNYISVENMMISNWYKDGVLVENASHIRMTNCTVVYNGRRAQSWDHGIVCDSCTHVVIQNCVIKDNYVCGINPIECQYVLIKDCEISDNNGNKSYGEYFDDADGMNVQNSQHVIVEGCRVFANGEDGIDIDVYEGYSGELYDVVVREC